MKTKPVPRTIRRDDSIDRYRINQLLPAPGFRVFTCSGAHISPHDDISQYREGGLYHKPDAEIVDDAIGNTYSVEVEERTAIGWGVVRRDGEDEIRLFIFDADNQEVIDLLKDDAEFGNTSIILRPGEEFTEEMKSDLIGRTKMGHGIVSHVEKVEGKR